MTPNYQFLSTRPAAIGYEPRFRYRAPWPKRKSILRSIWDAGKIVLCYKPNQSRIK